MGNDGKVKKGESIDRWIERQPPGHAELLRRVRSLIHETLPGLRETVKWSYPCFGYGEKGMGIGSLASHSGHVNLQLSRGAEIADVDGLIEGTGKSIRHIKLRPGEPFPEDSLVRVLKAASRLEGH